MEGKWNHHLEQIYHVDVFGIQKPQGTTKYITVLGNSYILLTEDRNIGGRLRLGRLILALIEINETKQLN